MAKDIKQEKEKKDLEEKEKTKEPSWFSKVPAMWKLIGISILVIMYLRTSSGYGSPSNFWVWAVGIFAAWWALGKESKARMEDMLTPKERDVLIRQEIERMKLEGQIPRFADIYYGPHSGLMYHEALPPHYLSRVEMIVDGEREHMRAMTFAQGPPKGFVMLASHSGRFQGTEAIPVISPIPNWWKRAQKMDIDVDKYLLGGLK